MLTVVNTFSNKASVLIETYWNVNQENEQGYPGNALVLIETYWNVNLFRLMYVVECFYCINRNILECKYQRKTALYMALEVLIETYWNVNIRLCLHSAQTRRVLIETYWNVNMYGQGMEISSLEVLIETYWNVNKDAEFVIRIIESSINRNILECKWQ